MHPRGRFVSVANPWRPSFRGSHQRPPAR
jgi:hypothetical protein